MNYWSRHPRLARQLLHLSARWGFPVSLILASGSIHSYPFLITGVIWLIFGGYPALWYERVVLPSIYKTLQCPRCGLELDAIGVWESGGYHDHKERHISQFKNPETGARIGKTDCPNCKSTILI